MSVRSDIQYNSGGSCPSSGYRKKCKKSRIEHILDYEEAMKRIVLLPASERKGALKRWKEGYEP